MKLGKKPARHDPRTLDYARYSASDGEAPRQSHWGHGLTFAMDGNDALGDCVEAAYAHQVQAWGIHAGTLTEAQVPGESDTIEAYSAIAGYVPGDPSTDNGTDMLSACRYWKSTGMAGQKITAYASLNPADVGSVRESVAWYGGAYIGLALPLTAQDQVGQQWAVETGPDAAAGSWGGHCVPVVGYGPDQLWCVTWGALQSMSWDFLTAYCDEAFVLLSQDWVGASGLTPSHLAWGKLLADLANL